MAVILEQISIQLKQTEHLVVVGISINLYLKVENSEGEIFQVY